MKPKGKLLALVIIAAAVVLVTATGAFTSVSAERTATVNVADDSEALLAMEPADACGGVGEANGEYARQSGGQLEVILNSSSGADGVGVNQNAVTAADCVFNVTNQGTQPVDVEVIASASDGVTFYESETYDPTSNPGNTVQTDEPTANLEGNSKNLGVGDTLQVGIEINTRDETLSQSDYSVTIQATAS